VILLHSSASLMQQAVEYFSAPGFERLMAAMAERYRALGRIGGSIRLEQLVAVEQKALSGVLGKDLQNKGEVTVKLTEFQEALARTRFASFDMVEILQGVTGEKLRQAGDERREFAEEKQRFFALLMQKFPHQRCREWLSEVERQRLTHGVSTQRIGKIA